MAKGARRKQEAQGELSSALEASLSIEEVRRATAVALLALDEAGRQRLLEQLPQETAEAIRPVLEGARGGKSSRGAPEAGKAKVREDWQGLWGEWGECLEESGSEEGRYVHQDAHWEPPYFDRSGVMDDLEGIAKRMRAIMERVWAERLDPKRSFVEEVREAANEIGAGPSEYFDGEGSDFGPQVTGCLLQWEQWVAQGEGLDAFEFVERIRNLEKSLHDVGLDGEAIVAFVAAMPEQDQRTVFEGLKSHRHSAAWSEVLVDANSGWFRLHQRLARKWDRAGFAESCRRHIGQDWTLALPLVSEQMRKKSYAEALALVDEAMRALLHLAPGKRWDPTQELLVECRSLGCFPREEVQMFRLLGYWQKAAAALGDHSVAAALKVQCAIGPAWEDWERALRAFQSARPACETLFAAWQSTVARASVKLERGDEELQVEWVRLLVAGAREGWCAPSLADSIRKWLVRVERRHGGIEQCKGSLATLLLDVDHGQGVLKKCCPKLKELLQCGQRDGDALERSRQRWMKKLGGDVLLPELLALMKRHIVSFVPDPADAHSSHYDDCADWMAAVHEFAPEEYRKLLGRWQDVHRLRRKLWESLNARRLPI
ncbi:MAG: hypothetical protein HY901_29710 [Deltaproteobacteria bacterium]|nr:hypothetical protein [Deltaproteobacteria bacterium]